MTKEKDTKKIIEKELMHVFKHIMKPSFLVTDPSGCHECIDRHNEIDRSGEVKIEDTENSCYSAMFFSKNTFDYLIPRFLIKVINKEKSDKGIFITRFLQELRNEEFTSQFLVYEKNKSLNIIKALNYIVELYYMEEYIVWDFDTEKLISFTEEKEWNKEASLTLGYWNNLQA